MSPFFSVIISLTFAKLQNVLTCKIFLSLYIYCIIYEAVCYFHDRFTHVLWYLQWPIGLNCAQKCKY